MIRCGNCKGRHANVAAIKDCYAGPDSDDGCAAAEMAYERYLEDRGADEAQLQDQVEAERGVIGFSEAWDMACPERVAEREEARREAYKIEAMDRLRRMITTPTRDHR